MHLYILTLLHSISLARLAGYRLDDYSRRVWRSLCARCALLPLRLLAPLSLLNLPRLMAGN